jgi:hypothetical protein
VGNERGSGGEVDGDNSGAGDNRFGIPLVVLYLVFSEDPAVTLAELFWALSSRR